MVSHHIVIVEDSPRMQDVLARVVEEACENLFVDENRQAVYVSFPNSKATQYKIHRFGDRQSALHFFETDAKDITISLMLLDLHLQGMTERPEKYAGFDLLGALVTPPNTIVITAETEQKSAVESFAHYRALAFVSKADNDAMKRENLHALVQIGLLYQEAYTLINSNNWWQIRQASELWPIIVKAVEKIASRVRLPEDINALYLQRANKITDLPDIEWSSNYIRDLINRVPVPEDSQQDTWGVLYFWISGLEDFVHSNQPTPPEEIHKRVALILRNTLSMIGDPSPYDFIGHFRGGYVVVCDAKVLQKINEKIETQFDDNIGPYYNAEDRYTESMKIINIKGMKVTVPLMKIKSVQTTYKDNPRDLLDFTT